MRGGRETLRLSESDIWFSLGESELMVGKFVESGIPQRLLLRVVTDTGSPTSN